MRVLESILSLQEWRKTLPANASVGFVPTLGALHEGHASLLTRARGENEVLVLSVYVNPAQFNQVEDFEKYPKTRDADLTLAENCGVDAVFVPKNPQELYPDAYRYRVSETEFSKELCGEFRPGHFDGVLTVVLKLFNLVKPTRAYFGEKDYQQLSLIRGMIEALFLEVRLVPCPTLREASGLALSSRNVRLSVKEKELAPEIYKALSEMSDVPAARAKLEALGFKVEYLLEKKESATTRRYIAAWLGNVRLIDNVKFK